MRSRVRLAGVAALALLPGVSSGQAPPPHYFVSPPDGDGAQFFGAAENYSGITLIEGYNLLAYALGDAPQAPSGAQLADPVPLEFASGGSISLTPFAFRESASGPLRSLPPGPRLKAFLDNPLDGPALDLSLPFRDPRVALSNSSALLRAWNGPRTWHTAVDFDFSGDSARAFEVVAAADGVVERNSPCSGIFIIRHSPPGSRPFVTVYQHLRPDSKARLPQGAPIRRGDYIGRVEERDREGAPAYTHLHFAVAVLVPGRTLTVRREAGGLSITVPIGTIPDGWYLVDPFGVYDFRRNRGSLTSYNYVPDDRLDMPVRGRVHAYAFRTDPPIGSVQAHEACSAFDAEKLAIVYNGYQFDVRDSEGLLFRAPTMAEAQRLIEVVGQLQADRSCAVGLPGPSMTYLLRGCEPPPGAVAGEDCVTFDPASLALRREPDGRFSLRSNLGTMQTFPDAMEAGSALGILHKHGFTRHCFVGRPSPSLQYFRR
jgi:murein DD-endopeptidase MepM/ murein hydrolase activator NlpD